MLRKVEDRGAIYSVKRIKQYARSIFQSAIAEGQASSDPTRDIGRALKPTPRVAHRAKVGERELPQLLTDIDGYEGEGVTRRALQFAILTAVRTDELRFGTCREIEDLTGAAPLWRIPKERMKMHREHLVTLSRQAVTIWSRWVFTMRVQTSCCFPVSMSRRKRCQRIR